ncbi:hypothetical protein [Sphingomonas guangdongensis]|uniref:hypothetical protein n=1 Tax=Sphingomonas guangdongensis TaxID=1141890 RepID=UPI0015CDD1C5|nr:hypothetical protein [Sphingomonas guangdongensis]
MSAANLAAVAGEVLTGKQASEGKVMKIEGKARRAKLAAKAAPTVAAIRAAADVNWSVYYADIAACLWSCVKALAS